MIREITMILILVAICAACSSTRSKIGHTTDRLKEAQIADRLEPSEYYYLGRGTSAAIIDLHPAAQFKEPTVKEQIRYLNDLAGYLERPSRDVTRSALKLGGFVARGSKDQEHVYEVVLYRGLIVGLLADPTVMIYSTPGGFIWPSMGALGLCDSEDELAALLAIELGHISLDHSLAQYRSNHGNLIATTPRADEWFVNDGMASNYGRLVVSLADETCGQYHAIEYNLEADRFATLVLLQAGYEPRALVSMLIKLAEASRSGPIDNNPFVAQAAFDGRIASVATFIAEKEMRVASTYDDLSDFRQARFDKAMGR